MLSYMERLLALMSSLSFIFASFTVAYLYITHEHHHIRIEKNENDMNSEGSLDDRRVFRHKGCETIHVAMIIVGVDASQNSFTIYN